jgi:NTE family protein
MSTNSAEPALSRPSERAIVLGGGGPVGRAWESGLAVGLIAGNVDLAKADLIIGTSAGAIVGAEIALGLDLAAIGPIIDSAAGAKPAVSPIAMRQVMAQAAAALTSDHPEQELAKVGRIAVAADTCSEAESLGRSTFAPLEGFGWPANFCATSVSTSTGKFRAWTAADGVSVQRAVAASSALPMVWPSITIRDDRYMDGGVRSTLNADLAAGYARILVVSCFSLDDAPNPGLTFRNRALRAEIQTLQTSGAEVDVIVPDAAFLALTQDGARMLDDSIVPEAFKLGRSQGAAEVERVSRLWS